MMKSHVTVELLESAEHALASLQISMAVPLRLLVFTGVWQELSNHPSDETDSTSQNEFTHLAVLPVPSLDKPEPFLLPVSAARHVIGIPVESTLDTVIYVVGESEVGPDVLLKAVFHQSSQIQKLRAEKSLDSTQLDSFADQVLRDFEERDWLLQLTEHLKICEVHRSLSDVVEGLLPHLKGILCARTVAFVPETLPGLSQKSLHRTICLNSENIDCDLPWRQIVQRYRRSALDRTFVRNWNEKEHTQERLPGIHSLMMAAVSRNAQVVGWLIAVNRDTDANVPIRMISNTNDPDFVDNGFGTAEAGLLRSAAAVLATHSHNLAMFQANQSLTVGVVRSLANAVDARDKYTHGHSDRVARMARHLARRTGAGPQTCEQVLMTGLLHDIGKIGVPDHVLLKPERLNAEETALICQHPIIGHRILKHIHELSYALDGVLHHHEAWNGKGYPEGLKGSDIPLFGRLLAIVDAYDAMTSDRPYRKGMSFEAAETILEAGSGENWDPDLVETFLRHKEEFRCICRESSDHCLSLDQLDMTAFARHGYENEPDGTINVASWQFAPLV